MGEVETVARQLSAAQRRYLLAVGEAGAPYAPRHGVTANWALRHKYVDSVLRLNDGREAPWDSFSQQDRFEIGIEDFLGQQLTDFGRQVREFLLRNPDA